MNWLSTVYIRSDKSSGQRKWRKVLNDHVTRIKSAGCTGNHHPPIHNPFESGVPYDDHVRV